MGNRCPKCHADNLDDSRFCHKCATPLPPSEEVSVSHTKTLETPVEDLTRGTTFAGRYEIIEELGKGGMGKVYRSFDKQLKEEVALKLIKPEIASDKKTLDRFSNELKIARKIVHKNVGRMYELMENKGVFFITMEYVPGQDLKGLIRQSGQLAMGTAISIAKQVCEGLAEAHKLGVIHRDLKPSNIMIDKEGNARIMDFGIARSLKAKGITGAGVMIGTPEYMSPEQVEAKETDQRSDIYSLGLILYEMVTGRVPFEGDTPLSIAVQHRSDIPKDPREINAQIPDDLSLLILRCLEKDKEKRYQSAGEVRSELTNIEKGIPTTERVVPERKPLTSKEITVTFSLKRLLIPAFIVATLVIAVVIILQLLPKKETVPVPSDKPSLAVMYFKNNTGDVKLDHLRTMLSDLLIADLSQSTYIRVLSGDKLYGILSELNQLEGKTYSTSVLKQVASKGGVDYILQGTYAKAGDKIRINVMLQDIKTEEHIGSEGVEGEGEESIFSMVDDLTRKIKANLKLSVEQIAGDIDKEVGKITTSSPEALKLFNEGMRFRYNADYRQSLRFVERAIALDPEFALAYRTMAENYMSIGYSDFGKKFIQKALELTDRVSERELYLIMGGFYSQSELTYDKAIEAYNKLLELYPEDENGCYGLGEVYNNIEEWDKALELIEGILKNKVKNVILYYSLAKAYIGKGMYEKSIDVSEDFIKNFQDNSLMRRDIAQNYLSQGKYENALAEVEKAFFLNPPIYSPYRVKGSIYHLQGDFIKAEEQYKKLLDLEEKAANMDGVLYLGNLHLSRGRFDQSIIMFERYIELTKDLGEIEEEMEGYSRLAYSYLISGNAEEALRECNKAWSGYVEADVLSGQIFALYTKGLIHLDMKKMDEAEITADELKELIEKGMNRKKIRFYYHLMGMIELKRENFSKAIENFKKAISLLPFQRYLGPHALFIQFLASAYYKSRDLEKAREEYERTLSLTSGRLSYGDIYAKSFYMLGKIYEQQDDKAKAIEHYEKFLDLWKDADPGIAEVEDARKRVAGLKSQ